MTNNKKIIILVVFIIIISIAVGLLLYNYFQQQQDINNNQILSNKNQLPADNALNTNAEIITDAYSSDDKLLKKAALEQNIKYCEEIKSYTKDECINLIAINSGNSDLCNKISDLKIKQDCLAVYTVALAQATGELEKCYTIENQDLKNTCLVQIFLQQDDLNYCTEVEAQDKTLCQVLINKNMAMADADAALCNKIQDQNLKDDCLTIVKNIPLDSDSDGLADFLERSYGLNPFKADTDNDGLNDYDEIYKYQTKPRVADTDGDGYSDGQEVKNNYDPLRK